MAEGGRYRLNPDGSLTQIEAPTAPHKAFDAPRLADGTLIGADGKPVAAPATPPATPAETHHDGGEEH